ncbi:MAG: PAS domain-containing protein, partial [Candidatus Eremiobacteraeota bacterium]|nr:PAS domain-containing protein [Candidatus Eremiobacteraeota bacterium]
AGLPLPALTVDRGGYVTFANPQADALFALGGERALGKALIEVIPSLEIERLMRRAIGGENVDGTVLLRRPDADATIRVAAVPIDGESGGALVIGEDRTQLVAVERIRRDFISDVSHELRTPLAAIKLMVETIELAGDDPEAVRMFLPKIGTELERIAHLVEDLLSLARNESGQAPVRKRTVDLRALVEETLDTFRPRAQSLGVDLRLEERPPLEAAVDPPRINQVLVNLVDNALRHTRAAGHVRVRLQHVGDGRSEATLTVEDDGVGIPFKDLPHIFERFYVVERSRARESSGTGLGLAIAKQIVEAHGGTIEAESELGRGTRFTCRLPL